jgi:hypothetical protein
MLNIYKSDNIPLYLVYLKWYIIICIICIIVFSLFKYLNLLPYLQRMLPSNNKFNLDTNNNNLNISNDKNVSNDTININKNVSNDTININKNVSNDTININKNVSNDTININKNVSNDTININNNKIKVNDVFYLYWTGGYDSTYRLCEMLIIEKKIVQPLYVKYALDNDCPTSEETCNKKWVRRNRNQELLAMKNIRQTLFKKYPWCKTLLLPTIYITDDINDKAFNAYFEKKFYTNNLWPSKRSKHQYLFLSKYAYYHKLYVDIGVLGIHDKSVFGSFLSKHLVDVNEIYYSPIKNKKLKTYNKRIDSNLKQNIKISENKLIKEKHYMHYLNFPCYGKTKKDLLIKAKQYNFDDILIKSWSCWFPNTKTNKECGKCPMCRERIVSHPNNNI